MNRVFGRRSRSSPRKIRGPALAGWEDGIPILKNDNDISPARDVEFHSGKGSGYRQAIPYAPDKPVTREEVEKLRRLRAPLRGRKQWTGFSPGK